MNKEVYEELVAGITDAIHMNIETLSRVMLLGELLVKKGIVTDEELMDALSEEEVARMMAESEELM